MHVLDHVRGIIRYAAAGISSLHHGTVWQSTLVVYFTYMAYKHPIVCTPLRGVLVCLYGH